MFFRGEAAFAGHERSRKWSLGKYSRAIKWRHARFVFVTAVTFAFPPFIPVLIWPNILLQHFESRDHSATKRRQAEVAAPRTFTDHIAHVRPSIPL